MSPRIRKANFCSEFFIIDQKVLLFLFYFFNLEDIYLLCL